LCHKNAISEKEETMFQVSDKASEVIKEFLKDKEEPLSVRIVMSEGG
jgi:Fe-S cluster assembly iron-binding protein IscA